MEAIKKEMELEGIYDGEAPENIIIPELVIYSEEKFAGIEYRTNCNIKFVGKLLNSSVKSVIVKSGTWQFYKDANFKDGGQKGGFTFILKPGYYKSITSSNLSSIKCIKPENR